MKLKIDKFGPIENAIFDIRDLNVFIGESGTGKSIIAKLIYISNTFFRFLNTKEYDQNLATPILQANLQKAFMHSYFNIFKDSYTDFNLTYFYDDEKYIIFSHDTKKEFEVEFSTKLNKEIEFFYINYKSRFDLLEEKLQEDEMTLNIYGLILKQEIKKIFAKENYVYIPAGRSFFTMMSNNLFSIIEGGVDIDQILAQFGTLFDKNKKEYGKYNQTFSDIESSFIKKQYRDLLKGSYYFINDEDRFYISKNQYLSLNQISSGQQELLPALVILWAILKSKTPTTIIFEEPEAHLFPKDQQRLLELLVYIFNQNKIKNRLLITTHSPYILSVLNNLIYAGKLQSKSVDENLYLNFDNISAYALSKNKAKSILNQENHLIDANYIDDVSNDIAIVFDKLLDEEYGE